MSILQHDASPCARRFPDRHRAFIQYKQAMANQPATPADLVALAAAGYDGALGDPPNRLFALELLAYLGRGGAAW